MIIYGASGHAKVIIDCLTSQNIEITAVFDDDQHKKRLLDFEIIHDIEEIIALSGPIIIAIGDNNIRKSIAEKISSFHLPLSTQDLPYAAIHASSIISEYSTIGSGTVIFQNAVIQTGTALGRHVIINTSASVDHDCSIDDFVHIAPNATLCGGISVGEGTLIGAGSVVIPNIRIGKWSVIGAGSVVIEDVPDYSLVVGNPGRVVKKI